jgi:hypothetical protein
VTDETEIIAGVLIPYRTAEALAPVLMAAMTSDPRWPNHMPPGAVSLYLVLQRISRRGVPGGVSITVPPDKLDAWYSPSVVAGRLGMTRQNVTKRCRAGTIRAVVDHRGVWKISPEELDRLVAGSAAS